MTKPGYNVTRKNTTPGGVARPITHYTRQWKRGKGGRVILK